MIEKEKSIISDRNEKRVLKYFKKNGFPKYKKLDKDKSGEKPDWLFKRSDKIDPNSAFICEIKTIFSSHGGESTFYEIAERNIRQPIQKFLEGNQFNLFVSFDLFNSKISAQWAFNLRRKIITCITDCYILNKIPSEHSFGSNAYLKIEYLDDNGKGFFFFPHGWASKNSQLEEKIREVLKKAENQYLNSGYTELPFLVVIFDLSPLWFIKDFLRDIQKNRKEADLLGSFSNISAIGELMLFRPDSELKKAAQKLLKRKPDEYWAMVENKEKRKKFIKKFKKPPLEYRLRFIKNPKAKIRKLPFL